MVSNLKCSSMDSKNGSEDDTKSRDEKVEMSTTELIIAIFGSSIGNVMEWFDFAMYVYFKHFLYISVSLYIKVSNFHQVWIIGE